MGINGFDKLFIIDKSTIYQAYLLNMHFYEINPLNKSYMRSFRALKLINFYIKQKAASAWSVCRTASTLVNKKNGPDEK